MPWVRPDLCPSPFPHTWATFDRAGRTFTVRDAPSHLHAPLLDFMTEYFMRDETLNRTFGLEHDEVAVQEFRRLQGLYVDNGLALVCTHGEEIVGCALSTVQRKHPEKGDELPAVSSLPMKKLYSAFDTLAKVNDVFDRFNVSVVMGDAGVSVHPAYRGLGIGKEILKALHVMSEAVGFKVAIAAFTSEESQHVAEQCGYRVYQRVPYKQISSELPPQGDVALMARCFSS